MREYQLFYRQPQTVWQRNADVAAKEALDGLAEACRYMLQDGVISDIESVRLEQWLAAETALLPRLGLIDLPNRVHEILADWHIDEQERIELKSIVETILFAIENPTTKPPVAQLPYDDPDPLQLVDATVVVTGTFLFGKRKAVTDALERQQAFVDSRVNDDTDLLIIGSAPSAGWAHGNYGRKIEGAITMKSTGHQIYLVSEEHWRRTPLPNVE